jgi:hypothetical protein
MIGSHSRRLCPLSDHHESCYCGQRGIHLRPGGHEDGDRADGGSAQSATQYPY